MNYRETEFYKTMDSYTACSIAEGFDGIEHTEEEVLTAWQWLVDTGTCWHLQGWYGRTATGLLEAKAIQPPIEDHKDYWGNTVKGTGQEA